MQLCLGKQQLKQDRLRLREAINAVATTLQMFPACALLHVVHPRLQMDWCTLVSVEVDEYML